MSSEIWHVHSNKVGSLQPFKRESDMESFLMNHPSIIGCGGTESEGPTVMMLRQQLFIKGQEGQQGKIDLIGLVFAEKGLQLQIYELKNGIVSIAAVDQLRNYLDIFQTDNNAKKEIQQWLQSFKELDLNDQAIVDLIAKPVGVLVGPKFDPEALVKAKGLGFLAFRMTRFRANNASDYYIIMEDEVGAVIRDAIVRINIGWDPFIKKGLISASDIFYIKTKSEVVLRAYPDSKYFDTKSKYLIFDDISRGLILKNKMTIINNAKEEHRKQVEDFIGMVEKNEGILITRASRLVELGFGTSSTYQVPSVLWYREESGESISVLTSKLDEAEEGAN